MKANWKITAALLALGIVSRASADNVVYLTGSTAFRSVVYQVLHNNSGDTNAVFDGGTVTEAEFGSSQAGANYMLFHGNINGTPTYINCAWSGSEAGIASAANVTIQNQDRNGNTIPLAGSPETWIRADGSIPMTGLQGSAPTSGQLETSSRQADLAQADTSQAVSLTPPVPNTSTALVNYGTEGIVTFTWAKNYNTQPSTAYTNFKNITIEQAYVTLSGPQPAGFYTGNAADNSESVYMVGRNKGSGTRANALADTGYGTTRQVQQFSIGGGVDPTDPANGNLILAYENNNGYESGGGVAAALGIDGSCQQTDPFSGNTGWIAIGYLGVNDALKAPLTTANWLTLDGVMESDGAITQGQYSFWGHEHLYGRSDIAGTYQDSVGQKLYQSLVNYLDSTGAGSNPTAHSPGIALSNMQCTKSSDVAYPVHN